MTTSIGNLTAAPATITLDGAEENLYPLRFIEWGILERWMRKQIMLTAKDAIEGLPDATVMLMLESAHKVASGVNVLASIRGGEGAMASLRSFEGMLRVLHLSLRIDGSKTSKLKFTYEELDEKIKGGLTFLSECFATILDISFPEIFGANEEKEEKGEGEENSKNVPETK